MEKQLRPILDTVLNREIVEPFKDSICREPVKGLRLTNAFTLLMMSETLLVEYDYRESKFNRKPEKVKEKLLFLGYLGKIFQSALILVGITDYLGAMALFRATFELLMGIATENTGSMKNRIDSVAFLSEEEKNAVLELWNELCAWAHPYGKWIKNICPAYYGIGRNYHPTIFAKCLDLSDKILDLMLIITIEHLKLVPQSYANKYSEIHNIGIMFEASDFKMFKKRLGL